MGKSKKIARSNSTAMTDSIAVNAIQQRHGHGNKFAKRAGQIVKSIRLIAHTGQLNDHLGFHVQVKSAAKE
jgi:hypothetical protein